MGVRDTTVFFWAGAPGEGGGFAARPSLAEGLRRGLAIEGDFDPALAGGFIAGETAKVAGRLPTFASKFRRAGASRDSFRCEFGGSAWRPFAFAAASGVPSLFSPVVALRGEAESTDTTGSFGGPGRGGGWVLMAAGSDTLAEIGITLMGSSTVAIDSVLSATLVATVSAPSVVSMLKRRRETLDSPL